MALPDELLFELKIFDEQFHLVDVHGDPMPNTPFRILEATDNVGGDD